MTIDTYRAQDGTTVVRLRGGCTDKINVYFKNREDALALLKALRKRER
jgi:hypothetical protein